MLCLLWVTSFLPGLLIAGQLYQKSIFLGPGLPEIPLVWVLKPAKYRPAFIFYLFKALPAWGISFFFFFFLPTLATTRFNFHLKHCSITWVRENLGVEMNGEPLGFLSCGAVLYHRLLCGWIEGHPWMDLSLYGCLWQQASMASLGAFDWWLETVYSVQRINNKVVVTEGRVNTEEDTFLNLVALLTSVVSFLLANGISELRAHGMQQGTAEHEQPSAVVQDSCLTTKTAVCTVFWLLVTEDKNYVPPKARIGILSRDSAWPWIKKHAKFKLVSWHELFSFFYFYF